MKLAVFVIGEIRTFEYCYKSWGFIESFDCDFFFSTWDKSIQKNQKLNIDASFDITENTIRRFFPYSNIKITSRENCFDAGNTSNQIYHLKECFKLYKNSKKDYDAIFIIRPDLYFNRVNFDGMKNLDLNKIYTESFIYLIGKNEERIADHYFFGGTNPIGTFINNLSYDKIYGCSHQTFARNLMECKIYPFKFELNNSIYRPNNNGTQTIEEIEINNTIWTNSLT